MANHTGNIQPQLDLEEHQHIAKAKRAVITGTDGVNYNELKVDSNGAIATTGGAAGVQYTEGDVDASITGTAAMWEDAGNTIRSVSAATPLPVNVVAGGSAGVQYTEGDVDASITGTAAMGETSGNVLFPLQLDASGNLKIASGVGSQVNVSDVADLLDNSAFADGVDQVSMAGFILDETPGTALTENDAAAARIDSKRAQICTIEDESTRGRRATVTAANALKVDGSAVTQPVSGTVDTELTTKDYDSGAGTETVAVVGIIAAASGGSVAITGDVTNGLDVDVTRVTGTVTVDTELPAAGVLASGISAPTTSTIGALTYQAKVVDGTTTFDLTTRSFYQNRTGVITSSGAGTAVDMTASPCARFTLQEEKQSGTVSAYNIDLQGSMDNSSWFLIGNFTSATGADAATTFNDKPWRFMRTNVNSITGASGTVRLRILAIQ